MGVWVVVVRGALGDSPVCFHPQFNFAHNKPVHLPEV